MSGAVSAEPRDRVEGASPSAEIVPKYAEIWANSRGHDGCKLTAMGRSSRQGPSSFSLSITAVVLSIAGCQPDSNGSNAPPTEPAPAAESSEPAAIAVAKRVFAPSRKDCDRVAVFAAGESAGAVCVEDVEKEGLTVVDLSDTWAPRVFVPDAPTQKAPEYRSKYLELANAKNADLGLNGIAPTLSIVSARLADEKRQRCDAAIDRAPLTSIEALGAVASDEREAAKVLKQIESKAALSVVQAELACTGLLNANKVTGRMSASTQVALEAFRRRNMIVGGGLDADTLHALALGGEELAFRALLRGLRERVADASGLIEDGTASETRALVLGREIDLSRFAPTLEQAIAGGAPDLVDIATDAAAGELGWSTPDAARAFVVAQGKAGLGALRVAVTLPAKPAYHSRTMDLRVEIDRGDVFYDSPGQAAAARKKLGTVRAPTFVVYAKDGNREVALMRWATTIGGWKKERTDQGEIALKYKQSDVGDRVWRQIIAAPAWLPPESTPEADLVHEDSEGNIALRRDLIQPGYRNAYGLVMMIHHEVVDQGGKTTFLDHGIRTHGSVDYRSIRKGTSHGCHRLQNQLALRLSGFLLEHRNTVRRGKMYTDYHRTLEHNDQTVEVDVPTRGYLYELDPPVPVRVLKGRIAGEEQKPVSSVIALNTNEPRES